MLDPIGSDTIQKSYNKNHKPLKADEILAQRSKVPGVDGRKRTVTSRITDGIVEPSSKRQKSNWVSKKEVQRLRQVAAQNGAGTLSANRIAEDAEVSTFDLWAVPECAEEASISEYVPKKQAKIAPATIKQQPITMTADGKTVPAVRLPKGGASYNPSFEEWEDLLEREGQSAVEAEKERLDAERKAAELQSRVDAAAKDHVDPYDDESEWEGFQSEFEGSEHSNKKRPERKTPSQRNKARRKKANERLAKHESRMDKRRQAAQIEEAGKKSKGIILSTESTNLSDTETDDRKIRRRKFGNIPIPEKPLEVILPEELQDSLRRLRPEGNLLSDRFRNILVQGKLEARKPVLYSKKKKVKSTVKWSHKDFQLAV